MDSAIEARLGQLGVNDNIIARENEKLREILKPLEEKRGSLQRGCDKLEKQNDKLVKQKDRLRKKIKSLKSKVEKLEKKVGKVEKEQDGWYAQKKKEPYIFMNHDVEIRLAVPGEPESNWLRIPISASDISRFPNLLDDLRGNWGEGSRIYVVPTERDIVE